MQKVLVTGAGAPGGPGIILALMQQFKVVAVDANAHAAGAFLGCTFEQIPHAKSPNFLIELLQLVKKHNINAIVPLVTAELPIFAQNVGSFLNLNCAVLVPSKEQLETINNKFLLLSQLQNKGVPMAKFYACTNQDELVQAAQKLHYPQQVFCVKPSVANGSRGFRIVDDSIDLAQLFWNHKPDSTYLRFEQLQQLLGSSFEQLLAMEYLPGAEFTVDCLANNGEVLLSLPRQRLQMRAGISTAGVFLNPEPLQQQVKTIVQKLQLHGTIGLQFKQDREENFRLLEINPRLQGTTVAAAGLGINFPVLAVQQLLNMPLNLPTNIAWGTHFVRHYTEVFFK